MTKDKANIIISKLMTQTTMVRFLLIKPYKKFCVLYPCEVGCLGDLLLIRQMFPPRSLLWLNGYDGFRAKSTMVAKSETMSFIPDELDQLADG